MLEYQIRAFASQKSVKNFRRQRDAQKDLTPQLIKSPSDEEDGLAPGDIVEDSNKESSVENLEVQKSVNIPSRGAVLQACTVTSGLIAALGIVIRQVCLIFLSLQLFYEQMRNKCYILFAV